MRKSPSNLQLSRGLACLILATIGSTPLEASSPTSFAGTILSVDTEQRRLTLQPAHDSDARLVVQVGSGDARMATPGMRIRGELVKYGSGQRLQAIWPDHPHQRAVLEEMADRLQRDTLRRGRKAFRSVGEHWPDFALWDQDGELFLSESLRGNYVVVNFIFTRCTVLEMCPASTERMRALRQAIIEKNWPDVRLVSITLDPDFDTPGIFTAYADNRGVPTDIFSFLTGPRRTIEALETQLGVLAEPDERQIIRHTMSTTLVSPSGEILYRIPGSSWSIDSFLKQIDKHRSKTKSS